MLEPDCGGLSSGTIVKVYLDPKEPTFLGVLNLIFCMKSLKKCRLFGVKVGFRV